MNFFPGELGTAGVRHAFDLLGMWVYYSSATCVRLIVSDESVRRPLQDRLTLPIIADLTQIVFKKNSFQDDTDKNPKNLHKSTLAGNFAHSLEKNFLENHIALYPFSLEQAQPTFTLFGDRTASPPYAAPPDMPVTTENLQEPIFDAPIVAGCFRNVYSYRRLLHPSQAAYSLPRLTADLQRQGYRLEKLVGVYPPAFLFWWILSVAAGTRFPAQHFAWEQAAMNHLSTTCQPAATFSHILVFYARRLVS